MKLLFKVLLIVVCSSISHSSQADTRLENGVEDDSWADAELAPSALFPSSPCQNDTICDRSQFLRDQSTLYSGFAYRRVELELRPIESSVCDDLEPPPKLIPLSRGDLSRYCLAEVANVRWLEHRQLMSGPECVSPISNRVLARSTCFPVPREPHSIQFIGHWFLAEWSYQFESGMFFGVTQGSRVRTEWRIAQLQVIRLMRSAPRYSLAVRHIDIDPYDGLSSRSAMDALCSFERRAIRQLELNFDGDVVVEKHDDDSNRRCSCRSDQVPPARRGNT